MTATMFHPAMLATHPSGWGMAALQFGVRLLRMPFDNAREQYAMGVRIGLIERSMLASRNFEQHLDVVEQATLGPLARRV